MERNSATYGAYLRILRRELVPATGCTEPIAIAFAAAKAREVLGTFPERVKASISGSIIKNAKSVVVPNTDQQKGIRAAVAAGIVAGDPSRQLEVIALIEEAKRTEIRHCMESFPIEVAVAEGGCLFEITVTAYAGESYALVRIADAHTNIACIERDGRVLYQAEAGAQAGAAPSADDARLSVEDIVAFANALDIADVDDLLTMQIECNMRIAEEGIAGGCGASIGRTILRTYGDDVRTRARAMAAAASDARMSGSRLPVVIAAGSGNQGLTASVPVIVYARHLGAGDAALKRALALSALITVHQKRGIGKLSAYCGAVSAGVGSGAGICLLHGGGFVEVAHTVVNAVAILSGMICDGAKASCAAKIAAAVDAGILGYAMVAEGQEFLAGDGIVSRGVEPTIANVCRLGREGMRETDREILSMMLEC